MEHTIYGLGFYLCSQTAHVQILALLVVSCNAFRKLIAFSICFLICKKKILMIPSSKRAYEDEVSGYL